MSKTRILTDHMAKAEKIPLRLEFIHGKDELTQLRQNLEALTGQIAVLVAVLRGIDRLDAANAVVERKRVDWCALSFFADHLEQLTNETLHEHILTALREAE